MLKLTRTELLEKLEEIECYPELTEHFKYYLQLSICEQDIKLVQSLLSAGAEPNPENSSDCYLFHLLHEYRVTRTVKGKEILVLVRSLLEAGANPNRVWGNNWRAYDYTVGDNNVSAYRELLLEYGAHPKVRDKI